MCGCLNCWSLAEWAEQLESQSKVSSPRLICSMFCFDVFSALNWFIFSRFFTIYIVGLLQYILLLCGSKPSHTHVKVNAFLAACTVCTWRSMASSELAHTLLCLRCCESWAYGYCFEVTRFTNHIFRGTPHASETIAVGRHQATCRLQDLRAWPATVFKSSLSRQNEGLLLEWFDEYQMRS